MTDLQKFTLLFGLSFKSIGTGKVEYRVSDLDHSMQEANHMIQMNQFALKAECIGSMAAMRAFQVRSTDDI